MAQRVKRLPTMWETQVRSLGQEDPLEKAMATHSSTLAWKNLWTEKPGRLQSMGSQRVGHDCDFTFTLSSSMRIEEREQMGKMPEIVNGLDSDSIYWLTELS